MMQGVATKKLMERACRVFGEARFERLTGISVSICTTCGAGHRTSARGGTGSRRGHARRTLFQAISAAIRKQA